MVSFGAWPSRKTNGDYHPLPPVDSWAKRVGAWFAIVLGTLSLIAALYNWGVLTVPFVTAAQAKVLVRSELAGLEKQMVEQRAMLQQLLDMHLNNRGDKP